MSDSSSTPPNGTQRPSGTAVAISRLADGQDALADALGEIARRLHDVSTTLEGYGRSFGDAHGHRAAAERRTVQQLDVLIGQGRGILERLTRIESRVAGAEMATDDMRSRLEAVEALEMRPATPDREPNGSGHVG